MSTASYKKAFLVSVQKMSPNIDLEKVEKAYDFAEKAHSGQIRQNGEPFITHPASTALYLARIGLDTTTLVAALLHDAAEDTTVTCDDIAHMFGDDVAFLVQSATKIKSSKEYSREQSQIKTLQRMFLAMAKDIRAVLVKLADRLHNMETLYAKPATDQKRIAQETLDIYAPIANRLGMGEMKGLLEDLAFQYLNPEEYSWVEHYAYENIEGKIHFVEEQRDSIKKILETSGVVVLESDGRVKHKYSLYNKLLRYNKDLRQIYDLVALRIVVPNITSCYESLGIIHEHFQPIPGRIKDYIAIPKPNGYQSLHTTVRVTHDETIEIQIRTPEMHREAEYGIAAHWIYKERESLENRGQTVTEKISRKELAWVQALSQWQNEAQDSDEYYESLKIDFFKDRIYVRTPKGDVFDLPDGATPIDFAFRVHTEIGNKCMGAKVNGKMVKMDYELQNNDVVEILTMSNTQGPKHKWLDFAKTHNARNKIRAWLRKNSPEENIKIGKSILERYIQMLTKLSLDQFVAKFTDAEKQKGFKIVGVKNFDELFEALGNGSLTIENAGAILRRNDTELTNKVQSIFDQEGLQKEETTKKRVSKKLRIVVNGDKSLSYSVAQCCKPEVSEVIVGYITKKKGITVHRAGCRNLMSNKYQTKIISASWVDVDSDEHKIQIEVLSLRQPGALRDIASEITNSGVGLTNIQAEIIDDGHIRMNIHLSVASLNQLQKIFKTIEALDFVESVLRV
jgi:GTP pyrophosphokinase